MAKTFSFLTMLLVLAGCTAMVLSDPWNIFKRPDVNLREKNYAAADYLIVQARDFIDKDDLIKAEPLYLENQPGLTSDIAFVIPEEIGVRFSQLGYPVDLRDVQTSSESYALGAPPSRMGLPDFILSGTHRHADKDLLVGLKLHNARTGRIIAAFDYAMPETREIERLSEPKTRIYKIER